uniref:Thioesterase domain-containing protein n=1 Tax=Picea sitchensis TaxID=3332 RepID=B8LQG2_PICSI|nr:unknown [Picea sitchensis]
MPEADEPLKAFGFGVELVTRECVSGRFRVTEICCQPFKVLHGGVSSLISEGLASMGAHIASGFQRIAGIELNINHLRAAALGEHVYAQAKPITVGRRVQVCFILFNADTYDYKCTINMQYCLLMLAIGKS